MSQATLSVFLVSLLGCPGQSRRASEQRTTEGMAATAMPSPTPDTSASARPFPILDAQTIAPARCTLELSSERAPSPRELLTLLFPKLDRKTFDLPLQQAPRSNDDPTAAEGFFVVELCRQPTLDVIRAPKVGRMSRIPLAGSREAFQVPIGVGAGIAEYTRGVLALTERHGKTLSLLAVADVGNSNDPDMGSTLEPTTRGAFGADEVLLTTSSANGAGEQPERSSTVDVRTVAGGDLKWAGRMMTDRQSNGVFWGGLWRWSMTSPGPKKEAAGYLVREHWTFVDRKTKKRIERDVERHYRLEGSLLVSSPADNLDTWPETKTWPDPPLRDGE